MDISATVAAAFDQHASRLNAFARAAVRDPATAEDLVQESFLRLVRQLRSDRAPDDLGRWLFRVCGNLIVSRARRASVAARWAARLIDRSHAPSPEDETLRNDRDRLLGVALARLPADARVALLLAARGVGSAEIGATISRSPGATRTLLSRSRLELRQILSDMGVESPR